MKTYLIDLDGTMYKGHTMIDGADTFLKEVQDRGDRFIFLTNNASRTKKENAEHMHALGFKNIAPTDFFTSSMAAAAHISKKYPEKRRAYFIGQDGLREALEDNHFIITEETPDFVFVGLDANGSYQKYSAALKHLLHGAILVGTNNDRLLAKDTGFNIGNGAIVAMFEYASGQQSEKIGKPHLAILEEALNYANIEKQDAIIIGDNLETDIQLGLLHGVETVFVTTGVHNETDIARLKIQPDRVISSLQDIFKSSN